MTTPVYQTPDEMAAVVRRFENCEYQPAEFTHAFHLTVAVWYLSHFTPEESLDRMRTSLLRFTRHHCVNAYHETITRFWLRLADDFLQASPAGLPLTERVNQLIRFARKDMLFEYYSRDLVMSDAARNDWVEPDLQTFTTSDTSQHPKK